MCMLMGLCYISILVFSLLIITIQMILRVHKIIVEYRIKHMMVIMTAMQWYTTFVCILLTNYQ